MILKTKTFQEAANKILLAVGLDRAAANLELVAKDTALYLRATNREWYTAVRFELEEPTEFRAVVDANLFLNLISGISTEEFELKINDTNVVVKAGKSSYKLAMLDKQASLRLIRKHLAANGVIANGLFFFRQNCSFRTVKIDLFPCK